VIPPLNPDTDLSVVSRSADPAKRHRVLIVDDAASTRRFLRAVLEHSQGFEVVGEAGDGDAAVQKALVLQPDLVLLDISMPAVDGASVVIGILKVASRAKVIVVSGMNPVAGAPFLAAGAAAFIGKGMTPFELLERIETILTTPAMGGDGQRPDGDGQDPVGAPVVAPVDTPPKVESFPPVADLVDITVLIVDGNVQQRMTLSDYLIDLGMIVTTADSGHTGLMFLLAGAARNRPFAVTLIDRCVSEADGLDLKSAIHAHPALTDHPVITTDMGYQPDGDAADRPGTGATSPLFAHPENLEACLRKALQLEGAGAGSARRQPLSSGSAREATMGRLLVAEDNLMNQEVAVAILTGAGYSVDVVLNGSLAVQAVAGEPYDAILMDCEMPELNGYQATAAIRALKSAGRLTPIIAVTAGTRQEDHDFCLTHGMDGYLAKPVSKDALLSLVAVVTKAATEERAPLAPVRHDSVDEPLLDQAVIDELRLLGAAEANVLADLVAQFVHDTQALLVQLGEALEVGNAQAVGRIAHSIKGSSIQLGGRRLAFSCRRLENKAKSGSLSDGHDDLHNIEVEYEALCRALRHQISIRTVDIPARPVEEIIELVQATS
jgi:CheY-like chemotaxis protein/HPt (histidine-containing phosphotransfer) domain-containing protein